MAISGSQLSQSTSSPLRRGIKGGGRESKSCGSHPRPNLPRQGGSVQPGLPQCLCFHPRCHSRESGNPWFLTEVPAFAGMTGRELGKHRGSKVNSPRQGVGAGPVVVTPYAIGLFFKGSWEGMCEPRYPGSNPPHLALRESPFPKPENILKPLHVHPRHRAPAR